MSAMSTQKRKIAKKYKERMAVIRAASQPKEYLKHKSHQRALVRWLNEVVDDEAASAGAVAGD